MEYGTNGYPNEYLSYKESGAKKMLDAKKVVARNKMIAWGFGMVLGIGISAVGSLSVLGFLTLPVVLPWILVGLGTTIILICNKRFLFHLCDNRITTIYLKTRKFAVFFSYVMLAILSGINLLPVLASLAYLLFRNYKSGKPLTMFNRQNLGLASNHLIFGGIALTITLAIAVFVFNFSPLAFVAVAPLFVLGILFKIINQLVGNKYRAKDESCLNDNVASPQRKLEEEEIFVIVLGCCFRCLSPKDYYDNVVEDEKSEHSGAYYPDSSKEEILNKFGYSTPGNNDNVLRDDPNNHEQYSFVPNQDFSDQVYI